MKTCLWLLCLCGTLWADSFEHRVVAAVLMGEAWGEGERGMVAVGEVIHERVVRNGQSAYAVVTLRNRKTGQCAFACLRGKTPEQLVKKFAHEPMYRTALAVARLVVDHPERLPGITRGATHFTRKGEAPPWMKGASRRAEIGKHVFVIPRYVLRSGKV